jgi:hypothetical protein
MPLVEVFCMVDDFPKYDISNFGQVRNRDTGRLLKPYSDGHGYLRVSLRKDNKTYYRKIHRLVCEAFIDNPNNYKCVDHKDRCKTNNHVSNLRWASYSMNNKNRKSVGNTNITGVCWVESRKRYQCQVTDFVGKPIRKTFSVSKYGNKARALQHARIWVTAMKREYGYL